MILEKGQSLVVSSSDTVLIGYSYNELGDISNNPDNAVSNFLNGQFDNKAVISATTKRIRVNEFNISGNWADVSVYLVSLAGKTILANAQLNNESISLEGGAFIAPVKPREDINATSIVNDISLATKNTNELQAAFDSVPAVNGNVTIPADEFQFRDGENVAANLLLSNYTTLETPAGSIMQGRISSTDGLSKHLIANEYSFENFYTVTLFSNTQDPVNSWNNTCVFNLGSQENPFTVGSYVYIRPAYTSGDTTNFFYHIFLVKLIDNSDPSNKKFTIQIPLALASLIPTLGNLICYQANAFIDIKMKGFLEQFQQRRGVGNLNKIVYIQTVLNKVLGCYVDARQIARYASDSAIGASPQNVSICLANAYDCVIDRNDSVGCANGVMVFGSSAGIRINGVGGQHKDDLIAIFSGGAGTPLYDKNGTQINTQGPILGVTIDGGGKIGRFASSSTVKLNSEGDQLIDGVNIQNVSQIGSGVMLQIETINGGTANVGNVSVRDVFLQPKDSVPVVVIASSGGTGTLVKIRRLLIDNLNIGRGADNASTGLFGVAGTFINFAGNVTTTTVDEIIVNDSTILVDNARAAGATVNGINLVSGVTVKRLIMRNTKWGGAGSGTANMAVNLGAATAVLNYAEFESCEFGMYFQNVVNSSAGTTATRVKFRNCSSFNSLTRAFVGNLPTNSFVDLVDCDLSGFQNGGVFNNGTTAVTLNIFVQGCYNSGTARQIIDSTVGSNQTFNIRSGGGNNLPTQVIAGAGRVWNFLGDCSDLTADINLISRTAGTIIRTAAIAGTIPAGVLAVCDATGVAGSWKALHNSALTF